MYIWWFLKFLVVFFCGKLTKPCRHPRTVQLLPCQNFPTCLSANPGKYYKEPKILTKRLPVVTTVLSGTNTITGALVYRGIPPDL